MDKHSLWITFSISIPDIVSNWHFYLLESQCKTKKTVSLSLPQLIICGQSLLTLICSLQKNSFCTFVLKALWALLVVYYYFTLKMSSWGQKCGFCFCLELFFKKRKAASSAFFSFEWLFTCNFLCNTSLKRKTYSPILIALWKFLMNCPETRIRNSLNFFFFFC